MNLGQDRQMQMVRGNDGNQFIQYDGQNVRNQNGLIVVFAIANQNVNPTGNGNVVATRAEGNGNGNANNGCGVLDRERELLVLFGGGVFDLISGLVNPTSSFKEGDLKEIEKVNANCILMANLQQASTSGTQIDKAPIYEMDQLSNVISTVSSVEQSGGIVGQNPVIVEETHAYFELLYNNLAIEVKKVNMVNLKLKKQMLI
uniref:Uncharacterized protein n=1 Tax=Tanacetum cinerariifolium TaxID=118510 RepID=A0A699HR26_TANCI|nr:hypothetical protein [Tanacetum cinerariifolium]